ncbi:MAG TPA: efflux RND transporter periplasmic adaptor subunit [Chthonomonadales bacterium]|nr:efflux RND transporter periplasmic adaptor subunit [Chthonomonadales bacterium]
MKHLRVVPLTVALLVLALAVWWWRGRNTATEVEVGEVKIGPLVAEWTATGYVEARTAQVSSPQVGRIREVLVHEGEVVRVGQALARLESSVEEAAVAAAEADVKAAQAEAKASQATLREREQTHADRLARAEAELRVARARWQQAQAALLRSQRVVQANLEAAHAQVDAARAELAELRRGARAEEIAQAEAHAAAAAATLFRARREATRQSELLKEGAISQQAMDDAREALSRAEAAYNNTQAALELLRNGTRPERIAAAEARLRVAEKQVAAAEGELAGLEVDKQRVAEAMAAVRSARAALAEMHSARLQIVTLRHQARASYLRAQQRKASAQQVLAGLRERTIVAPFNGVIGRRYVDPGDLATPSTPLFSVVEAEHAWIEAEVDEQDLAPVRQGQPVVISVPAYAGREFAGRVVRVGVEAIPQTEVRTGARIVRVRVRLEGTVPADAGTRHASPLFLKPGMEVHVSGKTILAQQAVLAPSDCLLMDTQGGYVFVVEGERVRKRRVRTGYISGPVTEILEGLQAGMRVVVSGKEGLTDGARVRIRSTR